MSQSTARVLADYCASDFSITSTDLIIELADENTVVTNSMRISKTNSDVSTLVLDGDHLTLLAVELNGTVLSEEDYTIAEDKLRLKIESEKSTLTITTQINPLKNTALEGLFKSGDAFCTQCEAEGFRRITYYLDRPDVMSTFSTKVIANKTKYPFLLSNGNKVEEGDLTNGQHFVTWHDPFPKPCYLFALVAGDFDLLADSYTTSSGREVALEIFVDKGNLFKAHHAMASLKKSMKWDEDTFGLEYDLDIYMIVAVDFFNMGAMENKGLNVFNSKFVLADQKSATDTDYFNVEAVIAHEYFHNWTGNRVTCRDWFQLSLKEGLTVFRDQQFSGDMHSAAVTRIQNVRLLRAQQFAEDAGPMSHPIRPEKVVEMNNFYTLTVYEKGAEVIRMIHTLLGKDKFRRGMDLYFKRFDGMAVTCDDFVDAMADASGVNLTQFKLWYSQSGTPELVVEESYDGSNSNFSLTVKQVNTPTANQLEKYDLLIPIKLELIFDDRKESHLLKLDEELHTWQFNDVKSKPVVAFLSEFSAPVKVRFDQNVQELEVQMVSATDSFNRWDAGQKLLTHYIHEMVNNGQYCLPQQLVVSFRTILTSNSDSALKAEQLTLPSFDELIGQFNQVDPIVLLNVLDTLKLFLAENLKEKLFSLYNTLVQKNYSNDGESNGNRALKNVCLSYLTLLPEHHSIAITQYNESDNMTDTLASLGNLAKNSPTHLSSLISNFESNWYETPLVMDKWFSIQATINDKSIFETLGQLENHPLFTLTNPNRARSLIGAFSNLNPRYFHCETGQGYRFLSKHLKELNTINPQVASRLITPLIQFKSFDVKRQSLMKDQLIELASIENLSRDLKEKLDAALSD